MIVFGNYIFIWNLFIKKTTIFENLKFYEIFP